MRHITPVLLLMVFVLSGCYQTSVVMDNEPSSDVETIWVHKFIAGLAPATRVDAADVCGDAGVHAVESEHTFVQGLLAGLTSGIYTPITLRIVCAE